MKKIVSVLFFVSVVACVAFANGLNVKVEGPEEEYNLVKIVNNTQYADFNCTIYVLVKKGEKFIVSSTVGAFHLGGTNDNDSNKFRINRGTYLGLKLPDYMDDVTAVVAYKDLPFYDIVEIVLTQDGVKEGEEF